MAASARARFVYPDALCHPIRPRSAMCWRWRSRCVGSLSAVALGTAVARGGTITSASGWRAATLAYTPSWSYAPSPVERHHRPRHLVEQGANLGAIIGIMGGQHRGDDLAGVGVHAEMELSPRAPRLGAMLLDQPLAGPTQLQPCAVHQQVHRLSIVPSLAARPWAGRLQ